MNDWYDNLMTEEVTDSTGTKQKIKHTAVQDSLQGIPQVDPNVNQQPGGTPGAYKTDYVAQKTIPQYESRLDEINASLENLNDEEMTAQYQSFKELEDIVSRGKQDPWSYGGSLDQEYNMPESPEMEAQLHAGEIMDSRTLDKLADPTKRQYQEEYIDKYEGFPASSVMSHVEQKTDKEKLWFHETGDRELYQNYYNAGIENDAYKIEGHDNYTEFVGAKNSLEMALKDAGYDMNVPDLLHQTSPFGTRAFKQYGESQDAYFPNFKKWRLGRISDKNPRVRDDYNAYINSLDGAQKYVDNVQDRFIKDKNKYASQKAAYAEDDWAILQREKQEILHSLNLLREEDK